MGLVSSRLGKEKNTTLPLHEARWCAYESQALIAFNVIAGVSLTVGSIYGQLGLDAAHGCLLVALGLMAYINSRRVGLMHTHPHVVNGQVAVSLLLAALQYSRAGISLAMYSYLGQYYYNRAPFTFYTVLPAPDDNTNFNDYPWPVLFLVHMILGDIVLFFLPAQIILFTANLNILMRTVFPFFQAPDKVIMTHGHHQGLGPHDQTVLVNAA